MLSPDACKTRSQLCDGHLATFILLREFLHKAVIAVNKHFGSFYTGEGCFLGGDRGCFLDSPEIVLILHGSFASSTIESGFYRRTSRNLGAHTDVRPHTSSVIYLFDDFGPIFHVKYGEDNNADITGLLFTERKRSKCQFCTYRSF